MSDSDMFTGHVKSRDTYTKKHHERLMNDKGGLKKFLKKGKGLASGARGKALLKKLK